jgi:hypothetical protein
MFDDSVCEETECVIPKGFDTAIVGGPDDEDGGPDPALVCVPAAPNI